MKKSLSIALSLLMVFSCISVLFTGITVSAAAGEMHTITTSVEEQNGLYGGVITTPTTQSVAYDYSATVTAVPYYGNGFLGWYNGTEKVSSELSYTFIVKGDTTLTAKFDIRNLVENGNMEVVAGQQGLVDSINNGPSYSPTYKSVASVAPITELSAADAAFGDYMLKLTPNAASNAGKQKAILCLPITVEKNTDYIWRFSYKVPETLNTTFNGNFHCMAFALNSALGDWSNASSGVKYTFHSQPHAVDGSIDTNTWSWGGGSAFTAVKEADNGRITATQWQDFYVLFNPGEDSKIFANGDTGTMYLMLGCYNQATTDPVYIDNMSVSKAVANDMSTVTATSGGSVTAQEYRQGEDYYVYTTYARGNASVYTGRDTSKVYYPSIYEKYTAKADAGSKFMGWYDGDTLVSKALTAPLLMTGKTYTAKFTSAVSASDGGTIIENEDGTYTAKAFYGNTFLGWYESSDDGAALVTAEATVDPDNSSASYAKFSNENQIYDGSFETGDPNTDYYWQNLPHYGNALATPTYTVGKNPVKNGGAEHGDNVMFITPSQITGGLGYNDKLKALLNYPVEVEAGKQYIWRFSYTFLVPAYEANIHYLNVQVDSYKNGPAWSGNAISSGFSLHSQLESYTRADENPLLQNVSNFQWSWNKVSGGSFHTNKNASGANEWVDFYLIFTAPETETVLLNLGTIQSVLYPLAFDNMSFTEVNSNASLPTVTAGENGTVSAVRPAVQAAFEAQVAANNAPSPLTDSIDATKPLYPSMYYSYFAKSDAGYLFDGWYDENDQKVSSDKELRVHSSAGGNYTAKFVYDPNRYFVKADVESDGGAYGGYLTGETEHNELTSGTVVTFSATTYSGNVFKGWYDGDDLVSTEETFEYTVVKNTNLVAKFERNNALSDSGYENTDVATSVLGDGLEWSSTANGAYGNVVNIAAKDGANSVNISAAGSDIKHAAMAVTANKTYHLAFNWMLARTGTDFGLEYVKVYNAADNSLIEEYANFTDATGDWQKFYANFSTGSATSVYFVLKYKGTGTSMYIDDVVLYDTATAPFKIKAEMEMDDIYPGYLNHDAIQTFSYGTNATVSVSTYMANKFDGWYKDGVKVSDNETYTFAAEEFATLTAKFEINNLMPDSGFENQPFGVSLSDTANWWIHEGNKVQFGFDAYVGSSAVKPYAGSDARPGVGTGAFDIYAYDGDQMLRAFHRNNSFGTTITGLKENTNYVFTFYWVNQNTFDTHPDRYEASYLEVTKLTGAQTGEELGAGRGVGIGSVGLPEYQKVTIPFFSGQNTEIQLEIKYHAGSGDMYIDNMALYESDYITLVAGEGGSIETDFNGGVSGPAQRGDEITLNAIPDAGYEFIGWYDYTDSSKVFGTNTTYKFNANGAVAIAAYFRPIGSTEDPINYFVDGDFENNCMIPPTFDHQFSGTDWCTYGITTQAGTAAPYSGENCLQLTAHSRNTNFLISNLEPFTTYTVTMAYFVPEYVTFDGVMVNERRLEWERRTEKDGAGYNVNKVRNWSIADRVAAECLGYIGLTDRDTEDKWQTLEFTFTTNNRTEAYMQFSYGRPKGSNNLYLDDIKIMKTSSGYTDELVNGDFEAENTQDGWQGADAIVSDGTNSYASLSYGETIKNNLVLKRYTDYTVTFKARSASSGTLQYGMTIGGQELFKADGSINAFTGYSWGEAELTAQWKEYSFDIASTDILNYSLIFRGADPAAVEIDDVVIEKTSSLKKIDKTGFEAIDGETLRDSTIQTITTSLTNGTGDWQANYALNKKYYELYTATAEGDAKVHSGTGSLIMKKELDEGVTLNDNEKSAYNASGAPLSQDFALFQLQPGKAYEISYWVKAAEAGTTFKSMLIETDSSWYLTEKIGVEITAGTEWQKVTHKIVVGETIMTGRGRVYLCLNRIDSELKSDVYIDDIEVVQTASSVIEENETLLYTQDISQNYLPNYSFESAEGALGAYSKAASDAVYGSKIGSFKAGDKVIIPVNTRVEYKQTFSEVYTLAASIRGNASAEGGIYVTVDPEGKDVLASFETDEAVKISPNTNGAWKRSGFSFADERLTTLYLVIECTAGSFDVDYLEFFNTDYGYKDVQYDDAVITFDPKDESNYVDPNADSKGNYITGTLTDLPDGSKVVLKGAKTYSTEIAADGTYEITGIANGTYNMYIAAGDAENMTLWGDITFEDTVLSGLACERLSGNVINVTGQGVRNGIVKITDSNTEWSYLTATNANGEYNAYILDGNWHIEGTTNEAETLNSGKVTLEQFKSGAATLAVTALDTDTTDGGSTTAPVVCAIVMVIAAATLVFTRKKGVSR